MLGRVGSMQQIPIIGNKFVAITAIIIEPYPDMESFEFVLSVSSNIICPKVALNIVLNGAGNVIATVEPRSKVQFVFADSATMNTSCQRAELNTARNAAASYRSMHEPVKYTPQILHITQPSIANTMNTIFDSAERRFARADLATKNTIWQKAGLNTVRRSALDRMLILADARDYAIDSAYRAAILRGKHNYRERIEIRSGVLRKGTRADRELQTAEILR